jgi:hypothetical protein
MLAVLPKFYLVFPQFVHVNYGMLPWNSPRLYSLTYWHCCRINKWMFAKYGYWHTEFINIWTTIKRIVMNQILFLFALFVKRLTHVQQEGRSFIEFWGPFVNTNISNANLAGSGCWKVWFLYTKRNAALCYEIVNGEMSSANKRDLVASHSYRCFMKDHTKILNPREY